LLWRPSRGNAGPNENLLVAAGKLADDRSKVIRIIVRTIILGTDQLRSRRIKVKTSLHLSSQMVIGVQVWLVSSLKANKMVPQDSLALLGDLKAEVRSIIERYA
jgi:hypothetical protein